MPKTFKQLIGDKDHPIWKIGYALCAILALKLTVNNFDASEIKTIATALGLGGGLKVIQMLGKKLS